MGCTKVLPVGLAESSGFYLVASPAGLGSTQMTVPAQSIAVLQFGARLKILRSWPTTGFLGTTVLVLFHQIH